MEQLKRLNRKYLLAVAFVGLVMITGGMAQLLSQGMSSGAEPQVRKQAAPDSLALGASSGETTSTERKRAIRYSIDLEVADVADAMDRTERLAEDHGGYSTSSSFDRDDGRSGNLELKIPEENATAFVEDIKGLYTVESSRKDIEDVTERYTELELELKNKRQELKRLEELMNRSDSVENTIKIQERMSEVRSRVQFLESQLEQLDRRVEYTTVSISYEEPQPLTHEFELRESFRQAYRGIFQSLDLMIVGIGYLLPFLLLGGIFYKGRNLWRERKKQD
ncbi:MAG: DUF4349 domain-containing protein [Candidatus Nanohaloarchaea archaeon]